MPRVRQSLHRREPLPIFVIAAFSLSLLVSASALADGKTALFGAELEFTNKEIDKASSRSPNTINTPTAVKYKNRFKKLVMEGCQGCTAKSTKDGYGAPIWRISYPNGFWFEITTDPHTLEVKTKPSTAKQLKKEGPRMQRDIFDVAHKLGTVARYEEASAAHMHIGTKSAFGNNAMLLRNFLVDYANHPALAGGALHKDYANAPPIARLSASQVKAFAEVTAPSKVGKMSIEKFADVLQQRVFHRTVEADFAPAKKYQATSVQRIDNVLKSSGWTAEMRAMPSHESAGSFVRMAELLSARISFLEKGGKPVQFKPQRVGHLTAKDKVNQFFQYVAESGLRWHDYVPMLNHRVRATPPSMAVAMKALGGEKSPRFIQFLSDSIDTGIYDRKAISRWVNKAAQQKVRGHKKIMAKLNKAPPAKKSFKATDKMVAISDLKPAPKKAKRPFAKPVTQRQARAVRAKATTRARSRTPAKPRTAKPRTAKPVRGRM
jgi:hypothetical protein